MGAPRPIDVDERTPYKALTLAHRGRLRQRMNRQQRGPDGTLLRELERKANNRGRCRNRKA